MNKSKLLLCLLFVTSSTPAFAYIGPGMSGGVIAAVLGVVGAIFIALFGTLYYPIKRIIKKKRNASKTKNQKTKKED